MLQSLTYLVMLWTILISGIYGWINNIVTLFSMPLSSATGEILIRIVGIFVPPVGSYMGLFV